MRTTTQKGLSGKDAYKTVYLNYPVSGLADVNVTALMSTPSLNGQLTKIGFLLSNKSLLTGNAHSYAWWLVCFQAVGLAAAAAVAAGVGGARRKRAAAQGLLTVLCVSTFLFTTDVLNAPFGAYAWCACVCVLARCNAALSPFLTLPIAATAAGRTTTAARPPP